MLTENQAVAATTLTRQIIHHLRGLRALLQDDFKDPNAAPRAYEGMATGDGKNLNDADREVADCIGKLKRVLGDLIEPPPLAKEP
jgi:hypothetical protein